MIYTLCDRLVKKICIKPWLGSWGVWAFPLETSCGIGRDFLDPVHHQVSSVHTTNGVGVAAMLLEVRLDAVVMRNPNIVRVIHHQVDNEI